MIGIKTRLDEADYVGILPRGKATVAAVLSHPDWPGLEIRLGDLRR